MQCFACFVNFFFYDTAFYRGSLCPFNYLISLSFSAGTGL